MFFIICKTIRRINQPELVKQSSKWISSSVILSSLKTNKPVHSQQRSRRLREICHFVAFLSKIYQSAETNINCVLNLASVLSLYKNTLSYIIPTRVQLFVSWFHIHWIVNYCSRVNPSGPLWKIFYLALYWRSTSGTNRHGFVINTVSLKPRYFS